MCAILKSRRVALALLVAMLFGAVSPAIAAALFAGRSEILGRMLAIPAAAPMAVAPQEASLDDDGCPHEPVAATHEKTAHSGHHGNAGHESHGDTEHAAHGIFCSFCLSPSATVTLPAPAASVWVVTIATVVFLPAGHEQRPAGVLTTSRHPRDPPADLS